MKRFISTLAVLLVTAFGLQAQDWAKAKLEKSPRHQEWVKVKHDSREVQCFVIYPEVKEKATTVVLIHEIYGLTDWACEMADELAAEGYIVIAPDLLSGSVTNGGGGPSITNPKGSVTFWLADGKLVKYQSHVSGTVSFGGNDSDVGRTTTVEIKDVNATKIAVPDDAKKKLQ